VKHRSRTHHRLINLAAAVLAGITIAATSEPASARQDSGTVPVVAETHVDSLTRAIAQQLRCPVCQGLSIQDSPSELAQEMKSVVREQVEAGKTTDEVKQYFVARYGEWILLSPKAHGFNLAIYVLPMLAVIAGIVIIGLAVRRWTGGSPPADLPIDTTSDSDLAPWEDISR
jgi:cytochrome c-type biogenesis protein CcmH